MRQLLPLVAYVLALLPACAGPAAPDPSADMAPGIPAMQPSISGVITQTSADAIRVEANPAEQSGSDKAMVRLTADTRVLRRNASHSTRAELTVGQRVSVWFSGPVAESYPVQAAARAVVIEAPPN